MALALFLTFLAGLTGPLVALDGLRGVDQGLGAILDHHLPALIHAAELLRESERLASSGSRVAGTPSQRVRDELARRIERVGQEKARSLGRLRAAGLAPGDMDGLEGRFRDLARGLRTLVALAGDQDRVRQRMTHRMARLRDLSKRVRAIEPQSRRGGCLLRWQARALHAIVELMGARGATDMDELQRRERAFERALSGAQDVGVCGQVEPPPAVAALDAEVRWFGGKSGPFAMRRRQYVLQAALDHRVERVGALAMDLQASMAELFDRVRDDARAEGITARRAARDRHDALALVPVLLAATALGGYAYLYRVLIQPILHLRRAIDDHLRGRTRPSGGEPRSPSPRRDEIGDIMRAVRGLIDAQRRREAELLAQKSSAEHANGAKSLFLAQMGHELRTPLNAILGYADLLRRSPGLDAEGRTRCGIIHRSGTHLLALIGDLVDVASIETGRLRPVIAEIDLEGLLDDVAATARREARAKGLAFHLRLGPELPERVLTDGRRLRQVLLNLTDNAVKYTATGTVTLEAAGARRAGRSLWLHFAVADTGPAIPPQQQARIFEPFERLHPGQPGSGLGLAISRDLVALLGGELRLESRPGEGSRFWFRLPVEAAPDAPSGPRPVSGYRGPPRRVLVVDDRLEDRCLLRDLLVPLGFTVDLAGGAQEALARAARTPPDLVLMDLVMPGRCGYAAAWSLRRLPGLGELPVAAVSAAPLDPPEEVLGLGFDAVLTKPVGSEALHDAVAHCLDLHSVREPGTAREPEAPPRHELETALELVRLRQWDRVMEWADDLAAGEPTYAPFARRVRALAAAGEHERLLDWLAGPPSGRR